MTHAKIIGGILLSFPDVYRKPGRQVQWTVFFPFITVFSSFVYRALLCAFDLRLVQV